jgi:hypothetical protein
MDPRRPCQHDKWIIHVVLVGMCAVEGNNRRRAGGDGEERVSSAHSSRQVILLLIWHCNMGCRSVVRPLGIDACLRKGTHRESARSAECPAVRSASASKEIKDRMALDVICSIVLGS